MSLTSSLESRFDVEALKQRKGSAPLVEGVRSDLRCVNAVAF
jgi:hypothetical protein